MHVLLVGDQAVGYLLVGALGVPAVPHRSEGVSADRLRLAQCPGQHHQADLGAAAQMRQDLGDCPVAAVRGPAGLVGIQRLDQRHQQVMRVAQRGDPDARVGLHC